MNYTAEQVAASLERMRYSCVRALKDAEQGSGLLAAAAMNRAELFAQAAADLAGTSVQAELDRAQGVEDPAWALKEYSRARQAPSDFC